MRTSVVELPYQFDSGEVGSIAIWRLYASGVIAAEYGDVVPLSIATFPPAQIHSKTRVVNLADLKGMKVRIGGATAGFVSKLLGATGVYVAIADVYTALNKDLVTGAIMDWGGIKAFRLEQVTKFHLDEPLSGIAGMVAMNKRSWAALSPTARAAFKSLTGEVLSRRIGRAADGEADQVRALVRKLPGHEIVKLSAPERAQWIARLQPVIANWVGKTPDGAKVLAAFQAEVKRLQAR